jgi:hypothetical protein
MYRNEVSDVVRRTVEDIYIFSSKCGSGFCPVVSLYVNIAKPLGSLRGI